MARAVDELDFFEQLKALVAAFTDPENDTDLLFNDTLITSGFNPEDAVDAGRRFPLCAITTGGYEVDASNLRMDTGRAALLILATRTRDRLGDKVTRDVMDLTDKLRTRMGERRDLSISLIPTATEVQIQILDDQRSLAWRTITYDYTIQRAAPTFTNG